MSPLSTSTVALIGALLLPLSARGDSPKPSDEYKQRDAVRLGVAKAIADNDPQAFATFAGKDLALDHVWFDTPGCRKLGTATVKAKDYPALVGCFSGLGFDAKTLLVRYGPDVTITLVMKVVDGKVLLVGLKGDPNADLAHPEVWRDAFEQHRKEGA